MKKLVLGASLLVSGMGAFAQLTAPTRVITTPVNQNGIENIIVEEIDATPVGAGYNTYRVFVDMAAGFGYQLTTGNTQAGELRIESTGTWFNDIDDGETFGGDFKDGDLSGSATLWYDSYVTSSGVSRTTEGVLFSEDTDGTVDGVTAGTPITTTTTPGLDLDMFGEDPNTDPFIVANGSFSVDPTEVTNALQGPTASNTVLIGQFTTDGDITMLLNFQTFDFALNTPLTIDQISVTSIPNQDPTGAIVLPTADTTVDVNDVVALAVDASDVDGSVASVEFFANGLSIGTDNTPNGSIFNLNWTASGTAVAITAEVTDNQGATVTTAPLNITVNDPCPVVVNNLLPAAGVYDLNAIAVSADASDCDQDITKAELFVDGSLVATDNTVNAGNYSFNYNPTPGTHVLMVVATNSAGNTGSASVSADFVNAAPSVAITAPAVTPFDLAVGNDTTFTATASDLDGSVSSVAFYVNGSLEATLNAGPYSFTYSALAPATVEVVAVATDNNGGTAADTVSFNTVFVGGGYTLGYVEEFCSDDANFCVPVITKGDVADVIGYDIEILYDNSKVTPTGNVIAAEELIADRDWTSYSIFVEGDSIVRVSLFFNGTEPQGTTFDGPSTSEVFCVEFARNFTFGDVDTASFSVPVLSESYANFVTDLTDTEGNIYTTKKETDFFGSLDFWADNSPIKYVAGSNLITEISNSTTNTPVVTPNAAGDFVYDISNGTNINIVRDVDASVNVQSVINGYDAYLTSLVSVGSPSYRPTVYQIIAMDVNRDGRIAAGDVSQISRRAVGKLDEFAQDWVFIPLEVVNQDFQYRISDDFPYADASAGNGIGYYRNFVPVPTNDIELPVDNAADCPIIETETFKGVLLGDVDGNYADEAESADFKSANAGVIVVDAEGNVVAEGANAVDFELRYDAALGYVDVEALNANVTVNNDVAGILRVSSYMDATNAPVMKINGLDVTEAEVALALVNGKAAKFDFAATVTSSDAFEALDINVYPNPIAEGKMFVSVKENGVANIYNAIGVKVMSVDVVAGVNAVAVDNLVRGSYVVEVVGTSANGSANVIIK